MRINFYIFILAITSSFQCLAQKEKKVSFIGGARSIMNNNLLTVVDTAGVDTTTAQRNNGGYALIDLGVNIKPNQNTEIIGMFRIKNNFGGFWGSGVTFDVRQLTIKGVVANALRYQLGDINLKQTPFTLYNHHADAIENMPDIFSLQKNIVNYERFYTRNTWRAQGANVDFGLTFKKYFKELNVSAMTTRVNATNFSTVPERLMSGVVIDAVQSKKFRIGYNANIVYDVKGTIRDSNSFRNGVQSIDLLFADSLKGLPINVKAEVGNSKYLFTADSNAPNLRDYFAHAYTSIQFPKQHMNIKMGYLNVGPEFRCIGAQSKDINYNALPVYFDRYTNAQIARPLSLSDVVGNENVYVRTTSSRWMNENNIYNNAMPFGIATNNRLGGYTHLQYVNHLDAKLSVHRLREIKGQGTLALRNFNVINFTLKVPVNHYARTKKKMEFTASSQVQKIDRKSNVLIENTDFTSMQHSIGASYELFKNFDLIGGMILQNTNGVDFVSERNSFTESIYFNQKYYDLNQRLSAVGARYNFSPKIYLTGFYQNSNYQDALHEHADFKMNQFNIIYNMIF